METKKNHSVDIHRMRCLFFFIGMITSLGITITAFQWESKKVVHENRTPVDWNIMTALIEVPVTEVEPPKPAFVVEKRIASSQPTLEAATIVESTTEQSDTRTPYMTDVSNLNFTTTFEAEPEGCDTEVFVVVESLPTPIGGFVQFYREVGEDLEYPAAARRQETEGRVYVKFIVEKDGSVSTVSVVKGIGNGCDEAAMKAVEKKMWNPGKQRGRPVRVQMIVPINFRLNH
jgi:protein TonB